MWKTKTFKTREAMYDWIDRFGDCYEWEEIFVNNRHGVTYRRLRVI